MQEAHTVVAEEFEQEDVGRGGRCIVVVEVETSGGEVVVVEAEWRGDRAELDQPVLEEVPSHCHGAAGPCNHPQHDVAPPPISAHVSLDDVEAEEEDKAAEVAAEARLVGAANGHHGWLAGDIAVPDLHHLVAGIR
ncbi:Os09g0570951, partial [Oryza sativa Japonica Group]